ncbi:sugar ABC transporter substrate-binding protein [Hominifimenecus sp. rT4P-3]|uniref:sugar ABC transporter substrate-binding protein n=1 Tax=Hominifimenecus sp. rT4P-3 TaxID=3242979 RepID=UPI003DA666C4
MKRLRFLLVLGGMLFLIGCRQDAEPDALTIGVSINAMRSPFMIGLAQGIRDRADELGIRLIVSECNGDGLVQTNQMMDFLIQDVDVVLVEPLDTEAVVPVIEEIDAAGIPIFCIDTSANTDLVKCWIGSDSLEMGRLAARYIAEALKERYGEYRGKVVDLMASLTTTSGANRTRGFTEELEQYPDIEIVARQNGNLQLDKAQDVMIDILQANPNIDAVWCSGDTNAQGALQAMRRSDRLLAAGEEGHIILVSADGAPESLKAIRNGYLDACISQNPIGMGRVAIDMIVDYWENGRLPEKTFYPYPLFTVTADNIDSEEFQEYGVWAEEIR